MRPSFFRTFALLLLPWLGGGSVLSQSSDPAPSTRPESRVDSPSHRIAVKVAWDGAVIAHADDAVRTAEAVRRLVTTIGEAVEQRVERAGETRFPDVLVVSMEVAATLPLPWLQSLIFDLESNAHFVEVGQDQFLETDVRIDLTVGGVVERCAVDPFKAITLVRSGDLPRAEKAVVAGLELRDTARGNDAAVVILGKAGAEQPDGWGRRWLRLGEAPKAESRSTPLLSERAPPATAADVGAALKTAGQQPTPVGGRKPRGKSDVRDVRGSDVMLDVRIAPAGRRADVVDAGSIYVGTIEVDRLPTPEHPNLVACKIIERGRIGVAPPFAAGQLVIFEPE
jgi:hypothetical protein